MEKQLFPRRYNSGGPTVTGVLRVGNRATDQTCRTEDLGGEVWYAGDANGGGRLVQLGTWWDNLGIKGPQYGYYPTAGKHGW